MRWMLREPLEAPADNGWRIKSAADSGEFLPNRPTGVSTTSMMSARSSPP
ncbi:hypothetical protein [Rathayibacter rathayi]